MAIHVRGGRRPRLVLVALLVAALLAACSSTEKRSAGKTRAGSTGSTIAESTQETTTTVAADEGGATSAGTTGGSTSGQRGTTGGATSVIPGQPPAPATRPGGGLIGPASGPGFSAQEIKLGFYVPDPAAFAAIYAALGVQGVSDPDNKAATRAILDYVNARGGIAGRKVTPVYQLDGGNGQWSAGQQAACSKFTEDTRVFAAITAITTPQTDVLAACLAAKRLPFIFNNRILWDAALMRPWAASIFAPSYLGGERWKHVIDTLATGGYFDRDAKVGIMWQDTGSTKRTVKDVIKPALTARRVKIAAEGSYPPPNSTAELSGAASQISSMVLRFRSAQVSHVLFVSTSGEGPLFFPPEAETQGYRPRYAFTSMEIPQIIATNVPAVQLRRAVGAGWWPTLDVDSGQDPKDNPAQDLCVDIARKAGVKVPDRFSASQVVKACDGILFLKAALDRAPSLTPEGLRTAADALGTSYKPAFTFGSRLVPGRLDGASAIRVFKFDEGCACFKYSSPVRAIG